MQPTYGKIILGGLFVFWLTGCGESGQRVSNQELAEEIKNREPRHITPGQIVQATLKAGETATTAVQQALTRKLQAAIPAEGLLEAGRYCQTANLPGADSVGKAYSAAIRRYRLKGEMDTTGLSNKAFQLLDAYRYNAENNLPIDPNVQGDGPFQLYSAPVVLSDAVCLKCHGQIGSDLTRENYQALAGRYRLDSLVNYKQGQVLAVWLLRFNRKEVIRRIPE